MDAYDSARDLYRDGRRILDLTRDLAVDDDHLRWAREDLEDVLLDLKLGVLDADESEVMRGLIEAAQLIAHIAILLDESDGELGG